MIKIPCLFVRDFSTRPPVMSSDVTEGCEWVLAGAGLATRKRDGTSTMFRDGKLYARFDCKKGRSAPEGFEPCRDDIDAETGSWPGWVPVTDQPQYKWHRGTWESYDAYFRDGTYELCGPKINGNPEGFASHIFLPHGAEVERPVRSYEGIQKYLEERVMEGIVFHHPDGRMAKIRRNDYGLPWPVKGAV